MSNLIIVYIKFSCIFFTFCYSDQQSLPNLLASKGFGGFTDFFKEWDSFKNKSNKDPIKMETFQKSLKDVVKTNMENLFFKQGVNRFFNMSDDELKLGLGEYKSEMEETKDSINRSNTFIWKNIPKSFDWRDKYGVTRVRSQGICNSCWSFTAATIIETHVFSKTGKLKRLSRQQGLDCFGGCNYKSVPDVLRYFQKTGGINSETCYGPKYLNEYNTDKHECKFNIKCPGAAILGFKRVTEFDEMEMAEIIYTKGPISAWVKVTRTLKFYGGGVYYLTDCDDEKNILGTHLTTIIGYGTENGLDYWLIKNSWGTDWGEDGYGKLLRNVNLCGIARFNFYPIVRPIE